MAKYTIELKAIMDSEELRPYLDQALSRYPMYKPLSENPEVLAIIPTREVLNKKILNHFRYYEIGFDTIGRFLDELEITMDEIMPYYNQMYNTCEIMALIDDPFGNVDVTETFKETHESEGSSKSEDKSNSKSNGKSNSNTKSLSSDLPQGNISVTPEDMDSVTHADNVAWNRSGVTDETSSEGGSTNTSEDRNKGVIEHTFTKKGNQGVNTYAHDMVEFRTSIIDVTTQILDDKRLKELFMQVF